MERLFRWVSLLGCAFGYEGAPPRYLGPPGLRRRALVRHLSFAAAAPSFVLLERPNLARGETTPQLQTVQMGPPSGLAASPVELREPVFLREGTTAQTPPSWLLGDWVVTSSKLVGAFFPKEQQLSFLGGFPKLKETMVGARMVSCLALPNVGFEPTSYSLRYSSDRFADDAFNDKQTLEAFFPQATVVDAYSKLEGTRNNRRVVKFEAPTVSKGRQRQRVDVERLSSQSRADGKRRYETVETVRQGTALDDVNSAAPGLVGRYTTWRRFDHNDQDDTVLLTLRVGAFDEPDALSAQEGDPRPSAVYDYSFTLRRPLNIQIKRG